VELLQEEMKRQGLLIRVRLIEDVGSRPALPVIMIACNLLLRHSYWSSDSLFAGRRHSTAGVSLPDGNGRGPVHVLAGFGWGWVACRGLLEKKSWLSIGWKDAAVLPQSIEPN
jgi:hypothetical protein